MHSRRPEIHAGDDACDGCADADQAPAEGAQKFPHHSPCGFIAGTLGSEVG